jgi:hypothetical protein
MGSLTKLRTRARIVGESDGRSRLKPEGTDLSEPLAGKLPRSNRGQKPERNRGRQVLPKWAVYFGFVSH